MPTDPIERNAWHGDDAGVLQPSGQAQIGLSYAARPQPLHLKARTSMCDGWRTRSFELDHETTLVKQLRATCPLVAWCDNDAPIPQSTTLVPRRARNRRTRATTGSASHYGLRPSVRSPQPDRGAHRTRRPDETDGRLTSAVATTHSKPTVRPRARPPARCDRSRRLGALRGTQPTASSSSDSASQPPPTAASRRWSHRGAPATARSRSCRRC